MQKKEYSIEIGGKTLTAEFNDLADQANGSVMLRYGNTVVLATAVMSPQKKDGGDFFPLTVDYEEKFYAAGQILGSRFLRREGRPTDEAILSGRIVDRTIRPLFDQHIRNEIQVVITVLSIEKDDPDVLAVNAASLALAVSDIPWNGPVCAVRLGKATNNSPWTINPDYDFRNAEDVFIDMVVCGKDGGINMIEVGAREVDETSIDEGLKEALQYVALLQEFQNKIVRELGKSKRVIDKVSIPVQIIALFDEHIAPKITDAVICGKPGKENTEILKAEWKEVVKAAFPEQVALAMAYYEEKVDETLHHEAIVNNRRADGRDFDEVRPLYAQAGGISPVLHGTGIFYRGGTHVLSVLTLGGPQDSQIIDGMEIQTKKRFMHHYNFPPFSAGETGRLGGTNRRMIGHGALAEKALAAVLPPKDIFPYTIRVVSESMASNGSTSMASVCAGTLSLMDGGVPISAPVAGIASGLMVDSSGSYKILTDIQGPEDHHGDMDFKVAGTRAGVTAIQMDVKIDGVPVNILSEALMAAKKARYHILDTMEQTIAVPRAEISPNAPKIVTLKIKPTQIGMVIGSGGKTINEIREKTETEIEIEDDGTVFITGKNGGAEKARDIIAEMTREYVRGDRFNGEVTRLMDFGAFVRIGSNTEGLVHISEIGNFRVSKVSDVLKEGDIVPIVIKEIDEKGRINLSIKEADAEYAAQKVAHNNSQPARQQ